MSARRRTWLWIAVVVVVAAVVIAAPWVSRARRGAVRIASAFNESSPASVLVPSLREGDGLALAVLSQRTSVVAGSKMPAVKESEAAEWAELLDATRAGFPKFGSYGRSTALTVTSRVLQRLAVEPSPTNWVAALAPSQEILATGLEDGSLDVRVTALMEIGVLWSFVPGRALMLPEENALADWKQALTAPVVRRLGDREPKARSAAIACLGRLPLDSVAAPAVAYLDDPRSPEVRNQVLVSFASRPSLLTEDTILKHMHDPEPIIRETAETVLKVRGLNAEQISLGSMIFNPKPEIRAAVIPLLKDRPDIDPVIWLIQLSQDPVESVRLGAVEALAGRRLPEVGQRLARMATEDASAVVRTSARKSLLPDSEKTAAMPPCPASTRRRIEGREARTERDCERLAP